MHTPFEQRAPDAAEAPADSGPLLGPLAAAPPLAMVALAAAVASLLLNQVLLRTLGTSVPHDRLVRLSQWFALPRNLAAVAGIVALGGAVYHFLRIRRIAPLHRRMAVAAFAGVFLPWVTFATLFPASRLLLRVVVVWLGAASILGVALALVGVRWSGPVGLRGAVASYGLSVLCALGATLSPLLLGSEMWQVSAQVVRVLGGFSEVSYLLAPLLAVPALRPVYPPRRARLGMALGGLVAVGVAALFFWGRSALRADFSVVFYGVQRLELLLDAAPWAYVLPLAAGFGVGAAALTSASPPDRQAGAGLLLVLSGGHAPKSPIQLLVMALGLALMVRSLIAQALATETAREAAPREGATGATGG